MVWKIVNKNHLVPKIKKIELEKKRRKKCYPFGFYFYEKICIKKYIY